jgi:hypothetical protein
MALHECAPLLVRFDLRRMLSAVQLDHQPSLDAAKIGDVRPYSMLSSEFRGQLSATQAHP